MERSETFQSSSKSHVYTLLDDNRSVQVTIYRWNEGITGPLWLFEDKYIIGSFVGPMKYLHIYFRQLYETLPGWRGYAWDRGAKWRTWFYERD